MALRRAKIATRRSQRVSVESRAERVRYVTRQVTGPLTLTKGLFPGCVGTSILVGRTVLASLPRKKDGLPSALSCMGTRTVKLLKTAFWLGVVIYNLPSPISQSAAPATHDQGSATKATSHCSQRPALCTKTNEALSKQGEHGERNSSRDAVSQDTLTPADRVVPWRGWALPIR